MNCGPEQFVITRFHCISLNILYFAIFLLQKKALRICTHSRYFAYTDPLFRRLKTLEAHDIHIYQTAISMFNIPKMYKKFPMFQNVFTTNSNIHRYPTCHSRDFHLNNPRLIISQRSIRYHRPEICISQPNFSTFQEIKQ